MCIALDALLLDNGATQWFLAEPLGLPVPRLLLSDADCTTWGYYPSLANLFNSFLCLWGRIYLCHLQFGRQNPVLETEIINPYIHTLFWKVTGIQINYHMRRHGSTFPPSPEQLAGFAGAAHAPWSQLTVWSVVPPAGRRRSHTWSLLHRQESKPKLPFYFAFESGDPTWNLWFVGRHYFDFHRAN